MKGTVKFFNESKGFGFITDDSNGEEIFVHASGLIDKVKEGDKVTYESARGKKGMNAVDVKLA
jgi:cold shock protein